jgi:hypothetical protein
MEGQSTFPELRRLETRFIYQQLSKNWVEILSIKAGTRLTVRRLGIIQANP